MVSIPMGERFHRLHLAFEVVEFDGASKGQARLHGSRRGPHADLYILGGILDELNIAQEDAPEPTLERS